MSDLTHYRTPYHHWWSIGSQFLKGFANIWLGWNFSDALFSCSLLFRWVTVRHLFNFPVGGGDPNRRPLLVRHNSHNTPMSWYIFYAALWWIESGYSSRAFQLIWGNERHKSERPLSDSLSFVSFVVSVFCFWWFKYFLQFPLDVVLQLHRHREERSRRRQATAEWRGARRSWSWRLSYGRTAMIGAPVRLSSRSFSSLRHWVSDWWVDLCFFSHSLMIPCFCFSFLSPIVTDRLVLGVASWRGSTQDAFSGAGQLLSGGNQAWSQNLTPKHSKMESQSLICGTLTSIFFAFLSFDHGFSSFFVTIILVEHSKLY